MDNRTLDAILDNFEGIVGFLTFVAMAIYWVYGLIAKTKKGQDPSEESDESEESDTEDDEYFDTAPPPPPPTAHVKVARKAIPADAEWSAAIASRDRRAAGAKPAAPLPKVDQSPFSARYALPIVSLSAEQVRNGFILAEILAPPISMRATKL